MAVPPTMRPPTADPSFPTVDGGTPDVLEDPREWLEEVMAEDALEWVKGRNAAALSELGDPKATQDYSRILSILDSKEKIPYVGRVLNGLYYNFWQDENHIRGIWRRTTLPEYRKTSPAWETVLDLDALGREEGESWVWKGSVVLDEGPDVRTDRVMIKLSRGGADATEVREFDIDKKRFIPEAEGGFRLPEAKSDLCYRGRDLLLVGTDTGEGSMTDSGYPRTVREWKRGTPLAEAKLVYEGEQGDVAASGYFYHDRGVTYEWRQRALTFWTSEHLVRMPDGAFAKVPVQEDAQAGTFADQLLITLRSEWTFGGATHAAGSLLAVPLLPFMRGEAVEVVTLFAPTPKLSLDGQGETLNYLILDVLNNVRSEVRLWRYREKRWVLEQTYTGGEGAGLAAISASGVCPTKSDDVWLTSSSYTQPTTYALARADQPLGPSQEVLKALPDMYDARGLQTQQFEATSADGEKVPYFLISAKALRLDGTAPTLLYGYGGFEISLTPGYAAAVGAAWLEKGYAYVQANIRGGGEYGPRWHQAALKENRNKAYEDFEAVAKDLVARGVTSHAKLGCQGGSNGGLLTGNMLARSPHLFGAIVCQVPLLDMRRFHKLLAGASWMGEYGDPDTEDWDFLQKYSPYHNVRPDVDYPPILFTTSTRDDRVHPGHARKMVAKMLDLQLPGVYYYENVEGGHGGAADNKQRAFMTALAYSFLWKVLGPPPKAPSGLLARLLAPPPKALPVLVAGVAVAVAVAVARGKAR
eukprot:CAMPEP_0118811840 /NCGR_PEP_ID=MMETSP1162-20130426/1914_1 /TAXON_ID=33656 /ORGANISM="Phaeocystis Sp, Strain CCMP2710" /LENGTH=754 /DNA_ID=CAMNT_0006741511 /DNA_START=1 /DNA_END=2265 /DNA_ORIENTATION=-